MINTTNNAVRNLISAQRRRDGQIAEGVYLSMQYNCDTEALVRLWIGTPETGPMLQFDDRPDDCDRGCYSANGWTPIYSRGDFGRNYACGGHWSGHSRNLINSRLIGDPPAGDIRFESIAIGGEFVPLPPCGIKGDVQTTSRDCSGSWSVFFGSAAEALEDRLSIDEVALSSLPKSARNLLCTLCAREAIERVHEVCKAFNL